MNDDIQEPQVLYTSGKKHHIFTDLELLEYIESLKLDAFYYNAISDMLSRNEAGEWMTLNHGKEKAIIVNLGHKRI